MLIWIRYIDHHWSLNVLIFLIYLICLILFWTQFCWNSAVQRRIASTSEELLKAIAKAKQKRNDAKCFVVQCLQHSFLAETEWWSFPTMQDVAVVTHRDPCDILSGCYARRVVEIHSTNERAGAWRPIGNVVTAFWTLWILHQDYNAAWSKSSVLRRIWLLDVQFWQMLCELFKYWGKIASSQCGYFMIIHTCFNVLYLPRCQDTMPLILSDRKSVV